MTSRLFCDVRTASACAALFPKTVANCQSLVESTVARAKEALSVLYGVPEAQRTFVNTCIPMDIAIANLEVNASVLSVVSHVAVAKDMRDSASKCLVELERFAIDAFESNKQLLRALKAVRANGGVPSSDESDARGKEYDFWLSESIEDYKRRGLDLEGEEFDAVVRLQKELAELSTTFSQNISEDATSLQFTKEELRGVPESVLGALEVSEADQRYTVKMDYPTYFGVMKNCEVAATRKAVSEAFDNRAYATNKNVLRELIAKRNDLARRLGYPSFAHLFIADKMAKTPEAAQRFVDDLIPRLEKKWQSEFALIKEHLHPSCVLTEKGEIESYDVPFMMNHIKTTQLNVDETLIQEYFPMDATIQALFAIYEAFFNIRFEHIHNGKDELWHKDASTLQVTDKKSGRLVGFIILDLHPREGKYSHACCHSVVPATRLAVDDGVNFAPALSVVLANFPAATKDRPSLLMHNDAVTFFHEFGHAIHGLMGCSHMATFAGTRVKRDFVELPSQMLEEWLWQSEMLHKVSSHYKTGQHLPNDLIEAKVRSQNAFGARDALRQLQFASYSLAIYGVPFSQQPMNELDTTKLFYDTACRVMPHVHFPRDTHMECAFGHLTGYGAGYYGYMWSKVFALDVFDYIRQRNGLLDPALGKRYVDCIIGVGGGQDPNDMLRHFLGREPHNDAFLVNLGIQ